MADTPHVIILKITAIVSDKLPSGEISGRTVEKEEKVFKIEADNKAVALARRGDFWNEVAKLCQ